MGSILPLTFSGIGPEAEYSLFWDPQKEKYPLLQVLSPAETKSLGGGGGCRRNADVSNNNSKGNQACSKCGPWIRSISNTWQLVVKEIRGSTPVLQNQKLWEWDPAMHLFNKPSRWSWSMLRFETHFSQMSKSLLYSFIENDYPQRKAIRLKCSETLLTLFFRDNITSIFFSMSFAPNYSLAPTDLPPISKEKSIILKIASDWSDSCLPTVLFTFVSL